MSQILVAGIGNISKGDDAVGVEVARRMAQSPLPAGVKAVDFGIRGIDLTYALLDDYNAAILVDTAQRGAAPGTLSIIVPERPSAGTVSPGDLFLEPHNLDPAKVLRVVEALGGGCQRILLVACEPETFGDEETGAMGLSPPVASAVDEAIKAVGETKQRTQSQTEVGDEWMGEFLARTSGADCGWNRNQPARTHSLF
jgi:hydrogenase maturation protease